MMQGGDFSNGDGSGKYFLNSILKIDN